jgi:purine catabolism regulator
MAITVRDLLSTPAFANFEVLAGKNGLDRMVTSVSVMDAPDIHNWIRGGEILMTTGYIMKDDTLKFLDLIKNINQAQAAALFVKITRFIDTLPEEVLALAEELAFPIVYMPVNLAFIDVIHPVLSQIVNDQARRLQLSENIHRSFTNLVLSGGETEQIINTLGTIIDRDVAYFDLYFRKNYISARTPQFRDSILNTALEDLLLQYMSYPIRSDNRVFGYLIYCRREQGSNADDCDDIAVEHASTVLKLNVQKKISNLEIEYRYKNEFIQDLIMNNIKYRDEVTNRASLYGWDFSKGLTAVLVEIHGFKESYLEASHCQAIESLEMIREQIFETCKLLIKHNFAPLIFASLSDSIVFLLETPTLNMSAFHTQLAAICLEIETNVEKNHHFFVTIGIGNHKKSVMDVHLSYQEAKTAVQIGRLLYKQNKTVFYKNIGVYKLLESLYNTDEAREFCDLSIGKLKQYDKKYGTEFFQTLVCINDCGWNLRKTAEKLYIHYNTIKYRYKKIADILNSNLDDSEERFAMSLAIKLIRMADE